MIEECEPVVTPPSAGAENRPPAAASHTVTVSEFADANDRRGRWAPVAKPAEQRRDWRVFEDRDAVIVEIGDQEARRNVWIHRSALRNDVERGGTMRG